MFMLTLYPETSSDRNPFVDRPLYPFGQIPGHLLQRRDRLRRAGGGPAREQGGFTHNSRESCSFYIKQSGETAGREVNGVTGV